MAKITPKWQAVLNYLNTQPNGQATLSDLVKNVRELQSYANSNFHAGQALSRMIKNGFLVRVKKGVYQSYKFV